MAIAPRAVTINRKTDPRGACDEKKIRTVSNFPRIKSNTTAMQ